MKKILVPVILVFCSLHSNAQQNNGKISPDEYAQKLGALDSFNVATIADTLTRIFPDKHDKARVIFYWIANNISLDPKALHTNDNKKTDPVIVIQNRKATPLGFAMLVQEMCSLANIRCLVVDGYLKNSAEDINNKADEINHSWNVIQLGQSPEQWYFVDAAKASGFTDKKFTTFTKQFTSEYFFADKALFNLDHFPDNSAWQLGGGPKNIKEFYALPVISNAAYIYGLQKPQPLTGYIKIKTKNAVSFSFTCTNSKTISNISLVIGEEKKQLKPEPVNFSNNNGLISFTYQFKRDDSYPVRVVVDGQEVLQYYAEITE